MITEKIHQLAAAFNESLKAALHHIDSEKIDAILDNRDTSTFSDLWMKAYQAVEDKITDEEEKAYSITAIWNFEKQNYFLKNL